MDMSKVDLIEKIEKIIRYYGANATGLNLSQKGTAK